MRADLFKRIEELQEKLVEEITLEADPDNWPGRGKKPMEHSQQERGDRYWCKKNAAATLTLLNKTISLEHFKPSGFEELGDAANTELDKEIARSERKAMKLLDQFQARRG